LIAAEFDGGPGGAPPGRGRQQGLTGGGELHPPAGAVEQRDAEARFQGTDLLAQRWLPDAELPCGAPEVEFVGERHEVPQVPDLHARITFP
jgi:hypothetical protein